LYVVEIGLENKRIKNLKRLKIPKVIYPTFGPILASEQFFSSSGGSPTE